MLTKEILEEINICLCDTDLQYIRVMITGIQNVVWSHYNRGLITQDKIELFSGVMYYLELASREWSIEYTKDRLAEAKKLIVGEA